MTTVHDDNASTWRDLADLLTPEQIAELACGAHNGRLHDSSKHYGGIA